ncbi:hypothetical protein FKM82_013506 [Ascaphus truei]|uniref:uncharacterized protein ZSWIM9-like n=1 Tax=Ascaphus truei TaxID=8439 RepID=UPI003F5AA502
MAVSLQTLTTAEKELMWKEFFSWEEFSDFFDDWCEQKKSLFLMRNSVPIIKCKWLDLQPEVVAALKFNTVRLLCKSGRSRKKTEQRIRKELCGAYIFLRLSDERDRLVISRCQLTHTHSLCPLTFSYNFKRGYLMANSCLPLRITNQLSKRFLGTMDIQRLLSACKTYENGVLDTLRALDNVTTKDPGAKVKVVFVKDRSVVKTVFILTSQMRTICQRFPVMMLFDQIGSINKEFDLYTLLCVDTNGQAREIAFFLTLKNTPDVLRFTLASLVQSIPEIKLKVQCITLGSLFTDPKVVKELLPNARVQICRSQVLETLYSKAQELGVPEYEAIWPFLCELSSSETLENYDEAVKKMKLLFPTVFFKYFWKHWHPLRHVWVKVWTDNSIEVDAGELIRLHQHTYLLAISNASTLSQCILVLMAQHMSEMDNEDLNGEEEATSYKLVCKSEPASLIEEELSFAKQGTYDIRETSDGFSLSDGASVFSMDSKLTSCSCTIYNSSLLPCRHLFIARFQTGLALFDMNLLLQNKSALLQRDIV